MSHGKWIKAYGGFGHSGLGLGRDDVLYLTLPCYHNNAVTVCAGARRRRGHGPAPQVLRQRFLEGRATLPGDLLRLHRRALPLPAEPATVRRGTRQ